jgi:hypothetical protein
VSVRLHEGDERELQGRCDDETSDRQTVMTSATVLSAFVIVYYQTFS